MGLVATTAVGVGAIVGGGIFVLSGAMIANAGPAALLALALNGVLALLTAMSFAEMATTFPENGGEYAFARRALSVRSAFAVGWVVWFAYAVAAALYALGFAAYLFLAIDVALGTSLGGSPVLSTMAALVVATVVAAALARWGPVGGVVANIGKVVIFGLLIVAGLVVFAGSPSESMAPLTPFSTGGAAGVLSAMGLSFIILQGFGNIAAVAGQVDAPARTLPRAMFGSLAIAMLIYGPLIFLILTVGVPAGGDPTSIAAADNEAYFAAAVRHWLGDFGWWLVVVAALLAMVSALQANLMAASGVGQAMAQDRTLPKRFATLHPRWKTPVTSITASLVLACGVSTLLPDPSTAGAAASLIFLLCFALVHLLSWLVRRRLAPDADTFRSPLFPLVPVVGGIACLGVALFQMVIVPTAGWLTLVWLGFGLFFYVGFLAARAESLDHALSGQDPSLRMSRGERETVLVPIASPDSATSLVALAETLVPPSVGRVMMLHVVRAERDTPSTEVRAALARSHAALDNAVVRVHADGHEVAFFLTVAPEPWAAIRDAARNHSANSVLLGLPRTIDVLNSASLNTLLNDLHCSVALLCANASFELRDTRRVLVPIGGSSDHDHMRARLLGALLRQGVREFTFLRIVHPESPDDRAASAHRRLEQLLNDEVRGQGEACVIRSGDPSATIQAYASSHDLLVLGATRASRGAYVLSELLLRTATTAPCATLILSRRG